MLVLLPCLAFLVLSLVLAACGQATVKSQPAQTSAGSSGLTAPLTAIRMLDGNSGWALTASSILKTADGGSTWQDVTPANAGINGAAQGDFLSGEVAWVAIPTAPTEGGSVLVWRTTNGGLNWQSTTINDGNSASIDMPHFLNAQQGWLAMYGSPGAEHVETHIWHSTDGGATWTQIQTTGAFLFYPAGISFEDTQTVVMAGNIGVYDDLPHPVPGVSVSHDGGGRWEMQLLTLPPTIVATEVSFVVTTPPVFFGPVGFLPVTVTTKNAAHNQFVLYRSNNSGLTWSQTSTLNITSGGTAYVLDNNHVWVTDVRTGKLYATVDGGENWSPISSTTYNFLHLSFSDPNDGWGLTKTALYLTTDGGKTWQQLSYSIQQ